MRGGRGWRRWVSVAIAATVVTARAPAQSIDPPIATYEGRARGSVLIANTTLYPVNYVIEAKSFTIACTGDVTFAPLDTARIHLTMSAMSGRIAAKQRVRVFYEANADSLPAWFALVAGFSQSPQAEGLSMRIELPHIVYLMQRDRVVRAEIAVPSASFDSLAGLLRVRVENHSAKLTRVLALDVTSSSGRTVAIEACPLFPNGARDVEYRWKEPGRPVSVTVRFPGFTVGRRVVPATPPPVPER